MVSINHLTKWHHLPWAKIYNRLYKLQANIYKASRECNIEKLNQLQHYIIDSSDVKIVAIQEVLNNIYKYYFDSNQNKYYFNDRDKFIIYTALYSNSVVDKYTDHIVKKIKQYIICICMQPEYDARFEKNRIVYYIDKLKKVKSIDLDLNRFIYIKHIVKNLDIYYLNSRIQALPYIKRKIIHFVAFNSLLLNVCLKDQLVSKMYLLKITSFTIEWSKLISQTINYKVYKNL